jgi:hypothetical protein
MKRFFKIIFIILSSISLLIVGAIGIFILSVYFDVSKKNNNSQKYVNSDIKSAEKSVKSSSNKQTAKITEPIVKSNAQENKTLVVKEGWLSREFGVVVDTKNKKKHGPMQSIIQLHTKEADGNLNRLDDPNVFTVKFMPNCTFDVPEEDREGKGHRYHCGKEYCYIVKGYLNKDNVTNGKYSLFENMVIQAIEIIRVR